MSVWNDWHTTVELTGSLCEPHDFEIVHQALQKLDEHEVKALYLAALDFVVLCVKHPIAHPSFAEWVTQQALEVERV